MAKVIQDEFTKLPVSRQRKWQLRQVRAGRCKFCTLPVVEGSQYCPKHMSLRREADRRKHGLQRRYENAKSYQAESAGPQAWGNGHRKR